MNLTPENASSFRIVHKGDILLTDSEMTSLWVFWNHGLKQSPALQKAFGDYVSKLAASVAVSVQHEHSGKRRANASQRDALKMEQEKMAEKHEAVLQQYFPDFATPFLKLGNAIGAQLGAAIARDPSFASKRLTDLTFAQMGMVESGGKQLVVPVRILQLR